MTSKQVPLLTASTLACLCLGAVLSSVGCTTPKPPQADPLPTAYASRRVWAVAPLRNESGSTFVDPLRIADQLAHHLETAPNVDVLPVNRTLAAMQALNMSSVDTPADAMKLLGVLKADAIVAGNITAYEPYDPPKLGLALELFTSPKLEQIDSVDVRRLTWAATGDDGALPRVSQPARQPVNSVSAVLNASDPGVRATLERYADGRGERIESDAAWRYRISMDLYSEFVTYVMSWRLLDAEKRRLAPPVTEPAPAARP